MPFTSAAYPVAPASRLLEVVTPRVNDATITPMENLLAALSLTERSALEIAATAEGRRFGDHPAVGEGRPPPRPAVAGRGHDPALLIDEDLDAGAEVGGVRDHGPSPGYRWSSRQRHRTRECLLRRPRRSSTTGG